jgi:hypothetical protein
VRHARLLGDRLARQHRRGRRDPDFRWHVSVAGESYLPKWADFVAIVQEVRPGVMFCVPMPPRQFWLNVNPYTLHVWELHDDALTSQWRDEARATREGQLSGRFPGRPEPEPRHLNQPERSLAMPEPRPLRTTVDAYVKRPEPLELLAEDILTAHRLATDHGRQALRFALECGELLLEAKAQVPTGSWEDWLRSHLAPSSA